MHKISLFVAVAAFMAVAVIIAGCTSNTSSNTAQTQTAETANKSTPSPTVPATPEERTNTTIVVTSSSKTDLNVGETVVTTGRLVDANGKGIPNQTIIFKSVAHVLGITTDHPNAPVTTDSTGNFTRVETISSEGVPSFITTVSVEGWIEYAGNTFYKPTSTPHKTVTIHFS